MGATLASCHIYRKTYDTVHPYLDKGYIAIGLSEGWTSVLSREGDGELLDMPAKKLSKALDAPVLSFLYFDDDLMTLMLFDSGKLAAQYRMDNITEPYLKHCNMFAETLGWDKRLALRLRRIFGCNDLEEKVAMLEEFFGVALRVDAEFLKDGTADFVRTRSDVLYREFDTKQKKLNKINNRMRVILTQEIDAKLSCAKPCIANYCTEGLYEYEGEALKLVGDELQPMLGNFRLNGFSAKIYPGREWYTIENHFGLMGKKGYTRLRVNGEGKVLSEIPIPNGSYIAAVLNTGDLICVTGYNYRTEESVSVLRLNEKGEVPWRVPFEGGPVSIHPVIQDGYIYFGGENFATKDDVLLKINEDGRILASLHTSYLYHYAGLIFNEDYIYYLGCFYEESWHSAMLKIDESLHIVEKLELPAGMFISRTVYDGGNGRFYFSTTDKQLGCIDIPSKRYTVTTTDEEIYLCLADGDGYVYGFSGLSTICVFDADMKLVSRNRLKGAIFDICRSETGVHVLTNTGDTSEWGVPEPPCYIRVYRIEPL